MTSIITPTYNRAHLLPRMIKSVVEQSFSKWELIIVDDGSTDNTKDVVLNYSRLESRIKYFRKENTGSADSRNYGVDRATGEYITFLDSDDFAKKNWLEELNNLISEETAVAFCGLEKHDSNEKLLQKLSLHKFLINGEEVYMKFLSGSFIILKRIFFEVGGYDITLPAGQHTDLRIRVTEKISAERLKLNWTFKPLVKVYVHQGARIRNNHEKVFLGSSGLLAKHPRYFQKSANASFYFNSVAGVAAICSGKKKEGKIHLLRAIKMKPGRMIGYVRLIAAYFSPLGRLIWRKRNE